MKVGIAFPARDMVHADFAFSAMAMVARTAALRPDLALYTFMETGTMIFNQRIKLADNCLRVGVDYVLWLDTDMAFPSDTLLRLLAHGRDIVAANCTTRAGKIIPVASDLAESGAIKRRIPTTPESAGLEAVNAVGMGVMLTSIGVLKELRARSEPLFWFRYSQEQNLVTSEDFYFCTNATAAGFQVWIDHDLSKQVKHIGIFPFGHEHVAP